MSALREEAMASIELGEDEIDAPYFMSMRPDLRTQNIDYTASVGDSSAMTLISSRKRLEFRTRRDVFVPRTRPTLYTRQRNARWSFARWLIQPLYRNTIKIVFLRSNEEVRKSARKHDDASSLQLVPKFSHSTQIGLFFDPQDNCIVCFARVHFT